MKATQTERSEQAAPLRLTEVNEHDDGALELFRPALGTAWPLGCHIGALALLSLWFLMFFVASVTADAPSWIAIVATGVMTLLPAYGVFHFLFVYPRRTRLWRFDANGFTSQRGARRDAWSLSEIRGVELRARRGNEVELELLRNNGYHEGWPVGSRTEGEELRARIERWLERHKPEVSSNIDAEGMSRIGVLALRDAPPTLHIRVSSDVPRGALALIFGFMTGLFAAFAALAWTAINDIAEQDAWGAAIMLAGSIIVGSLLLSVARRTWEGCALREFVAEAERATWVQHFAGVCSKVSFEASEVTEIQRDDSGPVRILRAKRQPLVFPTRTNDEASALCDALEQWRTRHAPSRAGTSEATPFASTSSGISNGG